MSRLFQIYEDDLADLERLLPDVADALMPHLNNALRVKIRRCQKIMSDVRWKYGPPSHVETISGDVGEGDQPS